MNDKNPLWLNDQSAEILSDFRSGEATKHYQRLLGTVILQGNMINDFMGGGVSDNNNSLSRIHEFEIMMSLYNQEIMDLLGYDEYGNLFDKYVEAYRYYQGIKCYLLGHQVNDLIVSIKSSRQIPSLLEIEILLDRAIQYSAISYSDKKYLTTYLQRAYYQLNK